MSRLYKSFALVALIFVSGARAAVYEIPLFIGADNTILQSFVRIQGAYPLFMGEQSIQITGYDDTGAKYGPIWLNARGPSLTFNSDDLERGNQDKGLPGGLGDGVGDWRLLLVADDEHLDVRSYTRNLLRDGALTPMHDLVASFETVRGRPWPTHVVPMLNPPGNTLQQSIVRIFNREGRHVRVELQVTDVGAYAWCDLPPNATLVRNSRELVELLAADEFGAEPWFSIGKWGLIVRILAEPQSPQMGLYCEHGQAPESLGGEDGAVIGVMALMQDTFGNLTNVSGPFAAIIDDARVPRTSEGDFDITLEFASGFNEEWRTAIRHSADRWEQIIVADYPSSEADLSECAVSGGETVDDLLIRFEWRELDGRFPGAASVCGTVSEPGFPAGRPNAGLVALSSNAFDTQVVTDFLAADRVIVHEIGHVLGIGTTWSESGFLNLQADRPEFTGPNALSEFKRLFLGGAASARSRGVQGVPVEDDGAHWRSFASSVDGDDALITVDDDLMLPGGNRALNKLITGVTVGALEDLGYEVDYGQADR